MRRGLELAAAAGRRTLSTTIELAIEQYLRAHRLDPISQGGSLSLWEVLAELWDPDEHTYFLKKATRYPGLLSPEETPLANATYYFLNQIDLILKNERGDYNTQHLVSGCHKEIEACVGNDGSVDHQALTELALSTLKILRLLPE